MGIGLGLPCCVCGPTSTYCERDKPLIRIASSSSDRLLGGALALENTFVLVRFHDSPGPCPEAAWQVGQTYGDDDLQDEGLAYWLCEFATEDSDWWYFERTGRGNGIEIVLMISKTGVGVNNYSEAIKLLVYDDTHYLNLIPKPGNPDKLISVEDDVLESSGLTWCDCPVDVMGLQLLPFGAARRWFVASQDGVTKMSATFTHSELSTVPTNYVTTWASFGGTNPQCNDLNGTNDVAAADADITYQSVIDGYCWNASSSEHFEGARAWQIAARPVRLGAWPADVLFTDLAASVPMVSTYVRRGLIGTQDALLYADFATAKDVDSSDFSTIIGEFDLDLTGDCETAGSLTAMTF